MKRLICIFISLTILLSVPISVKASDNTTDTIVYLNNNEYVMQKNIYGKACEFHIVLYSINYQNNSFDGLFYITGDIEYIQNIYGSVTDGIEGEQILSFSVPNSYGGNYSLDFYDNTGIIEGVADGFAFSLFGYFVRFYGPSNMLGDVMTASENAELYNECKRYSVDIYERGGSSIEPFSLLETLKNRKYKDTVYNYFGDNNDSNVSYVITHKKVENRERVFVIIRGTDGVEWEGNFKICPPDSEGNYDVYTFSDNDDMTHYNFYQAAIEMKENVNEYISFCMDYSLFDANEIEVVITGHSRGGAVSNLLAKELTDDNNFTEKVLAYTFATPNVSPFYIGMEKYSNIKNFCKSTDFIPCIPLANNNWNYWKHGRTYIEYDNTSKNYDYCYKLSSLLVSEKYANNVEEFYNKKFKNIFNDYDYENLYNIFQNIISKNMMGFNTKNLINNTLPTIANYKGITRLVLQILLTVNINNIRNSHKEQQYDLLQFVDYSPVSYETYTNILSGYENGKEINNSFSNTLLHYNIEGNSPNATNSTNLNELAQIKQFLNSTDDNNVSNLDKLGWDIDDETTWEGITFNNSGNVSSIDLEFEDLYGTLNLSNFTDLEYVNVASNWITSINLSGCTSLTHLDVLDNELTSLNISGNTALTFLDCSFNELTSINVSNNTALETLNCNYCGLTTIDISDLENLVEFDCGNNSLSTLDVSSNTELLKLYCILNHIDLTDSQLISDFEAIEARTGSEVVYEPQYLPFNAVYNSDEINAIEALAIANPQLDLLDEDEDLLMDNVQCYFEFEKINGVYRVTGIDISESGIEGSLVLSSFPYLKYLYCYGNGITGLDLYNCTSLQELDCTACEITNLVLPSNVSDTLSQLYIVNCENNHIDTNIFTTQIINNISSKDDYELNYKHQIIEAPVSSFNQNDYNALCDIFNQGDNSEILDWDLTKPGEWSEVDWVYDSSTQKYVLEKVCFDCYDISGDIDISACEGLEDYSFSGTDITSVRLPDGDIFGYAFYDCDQLESVYISADTDEIEDSAFYYCNSLTDVYYYNTSASWANVTIGNDNENLEGANIHFTDDNPHTHFWDRGIITTQPTCSTAGVKTYTCTLCSETTTEALPTIEHTPVTTNAVAPTCTETGLTEGTQCSMCNEVLTGQEIIPALGHNYVEEVTAPTCTQQGYTTHTCSRCDDSYVDTYVDALGHTVVTDSAVAPTCTETGLTEGTYCSVCNEVLTVQEVISALGHDYVEEITAPTCTQQGYTTHTCSRCDDSYVDTYVDALGHNWSEWISDNNATYEHAGTKTRVCNICSETDTVTELREGWYIFNGEKYYFVNDVYLTGKQQINSLWYIFSKADGHLLYGKVRCDGNWYYCDSNGVVQTGWQQINNDWYYFNSDGIMQTGWTQVNGNWFYLNENGVMQTGWVQVNGNWFYLNQYGVMQTGWVQVNGNWFYLNQYGVMQTGWVKVGNYWYYMNSYGLMQTGWLRDNGNWYYLKPENGRMVTGTYVINGDTYYFDSHGVCQNPYNPQDLPGGDEIMNTNPESDI